MLAAEDGLALSPTRAALPVGLCKLVPVASRISHVAGSTGRVIHTLHIRMAAMKEGPGAVTSFRCNGNLASQRAQLPLSPEGELSFATLAPARKATKGDMTRGDIQNRAVGISNHDEVPPVRRSAPTIPVRQWPSDLRFS